jgi:hypothetical protein
MAILELAQAGLQVLQSGKRKYLKPKLNEQDYRHVQLGVLYALG